MWNNLSRVYLVMKPRILDFISEQASVFPYPQMRALGHIKLGENMGRFLPVTTRELCVLRAALRMVCS